MFRTTQCANAARALLLSQIRS